LLSHDRFWSLREAPFLLPQRSPPRCNTEGGKACSSRRASSRQRQRQRQRQRPFPEERRRRKRGKNLSHLFSLSFSSENVSFPLDWRRISSTSASSRRSSSQIRRSTRLFGARQIVNWLNTPGCTHTTTAKRGRGLSHRETGEACSSTLALLGLSARRMSIDYYSSAVP